MQLEKIIYFLAYTVNNQMIKLFYSLFVKRIVSQYYLFYVLCEFFESILLKGSHQTFTLDLRSNNTGIPLLNI